MPYRRQNIKPTKKLIETKISEKTSLRTFLSMHGYSERRKLITKSNVAKIESIPIKISMTKNMMAHILLPGSMLIIAGYATKANWMPSISISSIEMFKVVETWPRNEKRTIAARIDVAEFISGNQIEDLRIFSSGFRQLE